jgi:asparagine synthase (glutamine-hydrolysing)
MVSLLRDMTDKLTHRGPDDSGVWVDPEVGIGLGHRRLSIIDLSSEGRQPMSSACGRYQIVFNGEIYNFGIIRKKLEEAGSAGWRGHSDTEVMLSAICLWGLDEAVKSFIGMFAFALWDRKERVLHLARDRMGEKPLYYGSVDGAFLFASELKALRAHPLWRGEISRDALALFLQFNYIPAPFTIYKGVYKLLPGSIISVAHEYLAETLPSLQSSPLDCRLYWSAIEAAERGRANIFPGTEEDAIRNLDELLRDAIRQQMVADVPLGAFLSGGIDSSIVVALMQAQSSRPVRTFTIGTKDLSLDEAGFARAVAGHLGTDHTELYVSPEDALPVITQLPTLFDEPFADPSQIPTFIVSRMTSQHVTVSLSGDGGDELFGGYNSYLLALNIWKTFGWLPARGRRALARAFARFPADLTDRGFGWLEPIIVRYGHRGRLSEKLLKLSEVLGVDSPEMLFSRMASAWKEPSTVVKGASEVKTALSDRECWGRFSQFADQMMFRDQVSYLPDDILVKVDRSAMGVSLETRVPMLDHRIFEFSWQIPQHMKIRNGQGKWLLRQLLHRYVPKEMVERPKRGFEVPIGSWLRGPLRDWAESLLDEKRLREEGYFFPTPLRESWLEHISGRSNRHNRIWGVLMFQAWLETT